MTAAKTARGVALDALQRVREGAYANLVLPPMLARSGLDGRDRRFVTDLVYGTTRMRRACDHIVDRFLLRDDIDPDVRDVLRLGAYQLVYLETPAHAAVDATVTEVHGRARGLVNAVLRKVATRPVQEWPDDATRLSYPDWIVARLVADLGREPALAALAAMNAPATVHTRDDGYVQDPASEAVARYAGGAPGERLADVCAAPGGKATLLAELAGDAAVVAASDINPGRVGLIVENSRTTKTAEVVAVLAADARVLPYRPASLDRVLVDAPCSGLGVLRRRPDARWRIAPSDVDDLVRLQQAIVDAAAAALRPGGRLVYSVCTLTDAEGPGIDRWLAEHHPELEPVPPPAAPWAPAGRGARVLPQDAGTDGMFVLGLTKRGPEAG